MGRPADMAILRGPSTGSTSDEGSCSKGGDIKAAEEIYRGII